MTKVCTCATTKIALEKIGKIPKEMLTFDGGLHGTERGGFKV